MLKRYFVLAVAALVLTPTLGYCADVHLNGAALGGFWAVPFVCMLLSIALAPTFIPQIWHHHFGKIALFWGATFIIPCAAVFGANVALYSVWHIIAVDYIPFIVLLLSLYVVASGVRLKGSLVGTPIVNSIILLIGTVLASWMGTTGAAMLFIRPMINANAHRKHRVHTIVFFIFLIANIGGSLTPLGDPPLFLGFLHGVPFFWTLTNLALPSAAAILMLLIIFFVIDSILYRKEGRPTPSGANDSKFAIEGGINFVFIFLIVLAVLMSGTWHPGTITIYHVELGIQDILRVILLLAIAFISWRVTNMESRMANGFSWHPITEVAKLFIGIFITIIPVLTILQAGTDGAFSALIASVSRDGAPVNYLYFWISGALSSFLDNAPTYLVFFNMAGGDPVYLTTTGAKTLVALSCGTVFMGAMTYIGNAPNFMLRSIAEDSGIKMPSFIGYMKWSLLILIPVFLLLTALFYI